MAFLKALVRNEVPFMVVGLAAAVLQGAPVVTQDIDLWFKSLTNPKINRALKKVGCSLVIPIGERAPIFIGNNAKLFDVVTHMHGLGDYQKEFKNSLLIPLGGLKIRVLSLERIIRSKQAADRQKDQLVLPVLKDTLLAVQRKKISSTSVRKKPAS